MKSDREMESFRRRDHCSYGTAREHETDRRRAYRQKAIKLCSLSKQTESDKALLTEQKPSLSPNLPIIKPQSQSLNPVNQGVIGALLSIWWCVSSTS